jgi:hypothetical protein
MKSKYSEEANSLADAILREKNAVKRWRMVHDLLRLQNKKARKEQNQQAKAMADIRKNKLYNTRKARHGRLVFGVSIPNVTWQALVEADIIATGTSVLKYPDKEHYKDKKATNKIVRDLAKAFPEYKASE